MNMMKLTASLLLFANSSVSAYRWMSHSGYSENGSLTLELQDAGNFTNHTDGGDMIDGGNVTDLEICINATDDLMIEEIFDSFHNTTMNANLTAEACGFNNETLTMECLIDYTNYTVGIQDICEAKGGQYATVKTIMFCTTMDVEENTTEIVLEYEVIGEPACFASICERESIETYFMLSAEFLKLGTVQNHTNNTECSISVDVDLSEGNITASVAPSPFPTFNSTSSPAPSIGILNSTYAPTPMSSEANNVTSAPTANATSSPFVRPSTAPSVRSKQTFSPVAINPIESSSGFSKISYAIIVFIATLSFTMI